MNLIYFIGAFWLVRGLVSKYIRKENKERAEVYMGCGGTIMILAAMEKYGFWDYLLRFF